MKTLRLMIVCTCLFVPDRIGMCDSVRVSDVLNTPVVDCSKGEASYVVWRATLGSASGSLVVAGERVLVGTNNGSLRAPPHDAVLTPRDARVRGDHGVLMCLDSKSGRFLWRATHRRMPSRRNDWPESPITSKPFVEGDRAYYFSNRGELVCVDLEGFADGENDGQYTGEQRTQSGDADFVWILDTVEELGVVKRDAHISSLHSSPLVVGDLVYCITGNGSGFAYDTRKVPNPEAPSFIAVHKKTGRVAWSSNAPGEDIIYLQGSSPACVPASSETDVQQVVFPGGDGRLYGFDARSGKQLWRVDCNSPGATDWGVENGRWFRGTRSFFNASPVVQGGVIYIGSNYELELSGFHPDAPKPILAVTVAPSGVPTKNPVKWSFAPKGYGGAQGDVAVADGIMYVLNEGTLFAVDATNGQEIWRSYLETRTGNFHAPLVHDGKVYAPSDDGRLYVFEAGRRKRCYGGYDLGDGGFYISPVIENDRLYVASRAFVWCLRLLDV